MCQTDRHIFDTLSFCKGQKTTGKYLYLSTLHIVDDSTSYLLSECSNISKLTKEYTTSSCLSWNDLNILVFKKKRMKFYQAGRGRSRAREQGLGGKIWRIEFSAREAIICCWERLSRGLRSPGRHKIHLLLTPGYYKENKISSLPCYYLGDLVPELLPHAAVYQEVDRA